MEVEQKGWFLVLTKPNHENIAITNLQRQGFHTYLPMLQQHKRRRNLYQVVTEPLFPRYLFINLSSGIDDWSKIRSTRGCISLVRFGLLPARIPDNLIDKLRSEEEKRILQDNHKVPDFKPGDKVQIVDGIFENYEGIIDIKNSQQRITLLLSISEGHTKSVSLSVHQVKLIN